MATFTAKTNRELQLENLIIAAEIETKRRERIATQEAMIASRMAEIAERKKEMEQNKSLLLEILN